MLRSHIGRSFAAVCESPDAKSVTSCPRLTSSSVSHETISSAPPYFSGGTLVQSGPTCAMRNFLPVGCSSYPQI